MHYDDVTSYIYKTANVKMFVNYKLETHAVGSVYM